MRASHVLQLSALLVGLCPVGGSLPPRPRGAGEVPASHLRMLSLGLAHLLEGVEENVIRLEKQGDVVVTELGWPEESLESISKESRETGRAHKQVRKDMQILNAKGDGLWRAVTDLEKVLKDLGTEQGTMQQRLDVVLERGESLAEPRSGEPTQMDSVKVLIQKQAGRIASLASEVVAQDRLINRRLQHIKRLEKLLPSGV